LLSFVVDFLLEIQVIGTIFRIIIFPDQVDAGLLDWNKCRKKIIHPNFWKRIGLLDTRKSKEMLVSYAASNMSESSQYSTVIKKVCE